MSVSENANARAAFERELLTVVGDGRWWERNDCLSNPQCRASVDDLDATKEALRILYTPEVCLEQARSSGRGLGLALFFGAGWTDAVDEVLQLGNDLSRCPGWWNEKKLVSDLRRPASYEAARFEVGVWAGLCRVGLAPHHESAKDRSVARADFTVDDDGVRVAIELKSLGDPQDDRNAGYIESRLSIASIEKLTDLVGTIVFEPSAEVDLNIVQMRVEQFRDYFDGLWPTIASTLRTIDRPGRYAVGTFGSLVAGPRHSAWSASTLGATGADVEDRWPTRRIAYRVLSKAASARDQLAASEAQLRTVVVWGGVDHMPCRHIGAEIASIVRGGEYSLDGIDYLGLLNSHGRGKGARWVTEAAFGMTRSALPAASSMRWAHGVTSWSRLWPGPSPT